MITIDEELQAAKAAKRAIDRLSPNIGAVIRKAKDIATHSITTLPSDRILDDARYVVVGALSNLLNGSPSEETFDRAKDAVEEWVKLLEAAPKWRPFV